MRLSIFVLVAAAAGLSAAACNEKDVAECMLPYLEKISDCGTDVKCACTNLDKELDCYGDICPGEVFPTDLLDGYTKVCPAGKYAEGTSAPTGSKTSEAAAATSSAAADMLMIPAGGMVAGLVGVLAWL